MQVIAHINIPLIIVAMIALYYDVPAISRVRYDSGDIANISQNRAQVKVACH